MGPTYVAGCGAIVWMNRPGSPETYLFEPPTVRGPVPAVAVLVERCGIGFTDIVKRPIAGSGELRPREFRDGAARRRALIGHIGSGGKQRQLSGGGAGTTQSMFTPLRQILLRRTVHRISALSRSHQHAPIPASDASSRRATGTEHSYSRDVLLLLLQYGFEQTNRRVVLAERDVEAHLRR